MGNSLYNGLLRRAYLIFAVMLGSIVCSLVFMVFIGINQVEGELGSSSLRNITKTIGSFENIVHDIDTKSKKTSISQVFEETLDRNPYIEEIYYLGKDFNTIQSLSKNGRRLAQIQIFNYKQFIDKNGIYIGKFVYPGEVKKHNFILLTPSSIDENYNRLQNGYVAAIIDMEALARDASLNDGITEIIDCEGYVTGLKNNIYDMFHISKDWKTDDSMHFDVNLQTGKFSFYRVEFVEELGFGTISIINFADRILLYVPLIIIVLLILVLILLSSKNYINFVRANVIRPIVQLKRLFQGFSSGDLGKINLADNYEFKTIGDEAIELYSRQAILSNELNYYKAQFDLLFAQGEMKILLVSARTGIIMNANRAALDFYGYSRQTIYTKTIYDLALTSPLDFFSYSIYDTSGKCSVGCVHKTARGMRKNVQICLAPVILFGSDFYFAYIWDTSKLHSLIANLKKSKVILSKSPVVSVEFNVSDAWKITHISPNADKILGYNSDEIISGNKNFYDIFYKYDAPLLFDDILEHANLAQKTGESEFDKLVRVKVINSKLVLNTELFVWFKIYIKIYRKDDRLCASAFLVDNSRQKSEFDKKDAELAKYRILSGLYSGMGWEYNVEKQEYSFSYDFTELLGYKYKDELGIITDYGLQKIMSESDANLLNDAVKKLIKNDLNSLNLNVRCTDKNGNKIWINVKGKLNAKNGSSVIGLLEDVTSQIEADARNTLFKNVFDCTQEGMIVTDENGVIVNANAAFSKITGYSKSEIIGHNPKILQSGQYNKEFYENMWKCLTEQGFWQGRIRNKNKSGATYLELLNISAIKDINGNVKNYLGIFSDITFMEESEKRLARMAYEDALTGLANKTKFLEIINDYFKKAGAGGGEFAVIYLDLDGFKKANDTYGHHYGDEVLKEVSRRMSAIFKDIGMISRYGGDEFVGIVYNAKDNAILEKVLNSLLSEISRDIVLDTYKIKIGTSIGVVLYPNSDASDVEMLIKQADWSMYQAKLAGKGRYYVFDSKRYEKYNEYNSFLLKKDSFDESEFRLEFQPVFDTSCGKIHMFEVLLRWVHLEDGSIHSLNFLHLFASKPWFNDLSIWVIEQADKMAKSMNGAKFGVNIPFVQLVSDNFFERFRIIANRCDLGQIYFEITDYYLSRDFNTQAQSLHKYINLGVRFIFDDFGPKIANNQIFNAVAMAYCKIDHRYSLNLLNESEYIRVFSGIIRSCENLRMNSYNKRC